MLESVSVFVKSVCDDHEEAVALPACCQKAVAGVSCDKENQGCCDDETTIVSQDLTSLPPKIFSDMVAGPLDVRSSVPESFAKHVRVHLAPGHPLTANGPPIYILHRALIFYA